MTKEKIEQRARELAIKYSTNSVDVHGSTWHKYENICQEMANWILDNLWTSVEDELPKEEFDDGYQSVFVSIKIDNETYMLTTDYIRKGKWELNPDANITHWMPIPPIPMEGDEK
jgi:hypothetical protein